MNLVSSLWRAVIPERTRVILGLAASHVGSMFAATKHPVVRGVSIRGVDSNECVVRIENLEAEFIRFWRSLNEKGHEEPFRVPVSKVLNALLPPATTMAFGVICVRFADNGIEYDAHWDVGECRAFRFPPVARSASTEPFKFSFGMMSRRVVSATLLSEGNLVPPHDVTRLVLAAAGPAGDFYHGLPSEERPVVNLDYLFKDFEPARTRPVLKMVDSMFASTYYHIEMDYILRWPQDAAAHSADISVACLER